MASLSIHPRNWYLTDRSYARGEKSNTSRTRSEATTKRVITGIEKHLDRHPNDAASARRLSALAKN